MNAAKKTVKKKPQKNASPLIDPGMKKPLMYSTGLHIAVVIIATLGLPFLITPKTEPEEMAITVELAELGPISQTSIVGKPHESKKEENEPAKPEEKKPVYKKDEPKPEPKPEPEKVETPPDDLLTPEKPEVEEVPEPPKEAPPEPEKPIEDKPPPKPKNKPKLPKPEKLKEEKKPEEKPKEEPKPKEEEPEKQEEEFSSLLKSLEPVKEAEKPVEAAPEENPTDGQTAQLSQEGKTLTRSEEDNLNSGVQPCWNLNAGGKYAEDLIVSLLVSINPDMSVRDVQIIDQGRYGSDSHFRAAAEAARRALLNPNCRNLKLPPEKYESWKVFKYNFDPSMML